MLVNFSCVSFGYGGNSIFSGVDFAINEGERVGLVGENGAGKTTLIRLLLGELSPDGGEVVKKNGLKVGYLEQNGGYDGEGTVYDEMLAVFKEELAAVEKLNALSQKLSETEYGSRDYAELSRRIEALEKYASSHDCYGVEVKVKTILNGMGFADFYGRKVGVMSGGEKTRLKLARLLLESPDLLVLDEPTNHLDVKTLDWLEGYLASFKGALFVVSHDRYFLDRVAQRTLEIENKQLYCYSGNYSKYKILKAERLERELKLYEKQREEREKLQTYVDKNIVRATTAKSALSRVKQLERMEILEKPFTPPTPPKFNFTYERPSAEEVLNVKNLTLTAGGKILLEGASLTVTRGRKIAVLGENGTGKSTLLKTVAAGADKAITLGRYVTLAYYDQEMANLNGENTVLAELWERHVAYSQTEARSSLARCGLYAEDIDKKVKELSGGERAKLAMCVFENERGNLLLLDEPTNHLDLPARESLEKALKEFDGTVIFVSHDRYFISAVADGIAEIEGRRLSFYDGGYEGYRSEKERLSEEDKRKAEEAAQARFNEERERSYRNRKDRAAEAAKRAELKAIEAEICCNEALESELNASLAAPEITMDYKKLADVTDELNRVQKALDKLYARYGELIG